MAASSSKRRFQEDNLQIRLASNDAEPLVADRSVLCAFSECVRGLPSNAIEWDISKLIINGHAVQRSTVVSWLNQAYMPVHAEPYEQQGAESSCSMSELADLLGFADAVGSSKGLLLGCASAPLVHADVKVGEQQLQIPMNCGHFFHNQTRVLVQRQDTDTDLGGPMTEQQITSARQQVAQQTEQLLYLAYQLQLPSLQQRVHAFIKANTNMQSSLLFGGMHTVLSDQVLAAAYSDKNLLRQLLANQITTQSGGFLPQPHASQLLKPVGLTPEQQERMQFDAEVLQDCFGCTKGDVVPVVLKLFDTTATGPSISVSAGYHVVQLLAGPLVRDASSMERLFGPQPGSVTDAAGSG